MRITVRQLEGLGACEDQVCLFAMYFGPSAGVTLDNCLAAVALGLDLDWAASHLLPAPAWERYDAERAQAWERYEAERAQARERYEAETAQARERYEAERAQAWERYKAETAQAFFIEAVRRVSEEE